MENNKSFGRRPFIRAKRKVCYFCANPMVNIDYKDVDLLARYISDKAKILPRRATGTCALHQRKVAEEIKKAREIALLPFVLK